MTGIEGSEGIRGNKEESESTTNIVLIKGNREEIRGTIIPLLAKALTFDAYFDHHDGIVVISNDNRTLNVINNLQNQYITRINELIQWIQTCTANVGNILLYLQNQTCDNSDDPEFYEKINTWAQDLLTNEQNTLKQFQQLLNGRKKMLRDYIGEILGKDADENSINNLYDYLIHHKFSQPEHPFGLYLQDGGKLKNLWKGRDTTRGKQMREEEMLKERKTEKTTSLKSTLNSEEDFSFLGTIVEKKYYVPWDNMDDEIKREFRSKFTLNCTSVTELKKNDQAYTFFSGFLELSKGLNPNDKKNPKNIFRKNLLCAVRQNTVQQMISMAENFIENYSS